MTPFEDAHEAGYEAFKAKAPAAFRDDDALLAYLTAALPAIRRMLAEELRAEAETFAVNIPDTEGIVAAEKNAIKYAADHLTRPEVMGG